MPGFAAAKPGTGQTARAIIAPASCRHDNCNAHCLINGRLSDLALYIAPLRPLPAGNPAGPALHNKTLCKLARGNDEPHAAIAPTALRRHTTSVLSSWAALRQLRRLAPAQLPESPCGLSAGRNNARLPGRVAASCHPPALSDHQRQPAHSSLHSPDIGSCAKNVFNRVVFDSEWRNPTRRPPGASNFKTTCKSVCFKLQSY